MIRCTLFFIVFLWIFLEKNIVEIFEEDYIKYTEKDYRGDIFRGYGKDSHYGKDYYGDIVRGLLGRYCERIIVEIL